MGKRSWTEKELLNSVKKSTSIRQVIFSLGLVPAGGNYSQIKKYFEELEINTQHFKGRGWNKGLTGIGKPRIALDKILIKDRHFQSYKLKKRLYSAGLKKSACEECGWAKKSEDGRLPLELHHINGNSKDNRINNLMILCPNCHSLKSNYRGRNIKKH